MTMSSAVTLIDNAQAWDQYVHGHPNATQYHRYGWLTLIAEAFGHRPIPLGVTTHGRLSGVLPVVFMNSKVFGRCMVSLPFVNYGGILGDSDELGRMLWDHAVEVARDARVAYLETRHVQPQGFTQQRKSHKVTMMLDMAASAEEQWKRFDAKLRNQIRKAEKSNLTVQIGGRAEIEGFYRVFARNMRDLGTPVYARGLFERVLATFPDTTRVFLVQHGDTVVAGGIAMGYRGIIEVPWAASHRDYLSMCPNNLLYWSIMQYAIKEGYRQLDFGRSTPGEGPYKFKAQWGAQPVPLSWEYWTATGEMPNLSPTNPKYALAISAWKRLPLSVTNILGPAIVRNIP
jgi:FemAB-related protein (PEP-CTERM system-associated)